MDRGDLLDRRCALLRGVPWVEGVDDRELGDARNAEFHG
jgi:hypothetical protein